MLQTKSPTVSAASATQVSRATRRRRPCRTTVLGEDLRPAPSVVAGGGFIEPFLWYMHHRVSVPIAALIVEHPANLSFISLGRASYLSYEPPKPMCYRYVRFGKLNLLVLPRTRLLYLIYRKDNVSAGPTFYRVFSSAAN